MHWYALSKTTGIATLCKDERDARQAAIQYDREWPKGAPYVATRLAPIDTGLLAAAQKTLEENMHLADGDVCTLIHLKRAVAEIVGTDG